jgi:hypothetical protein
MLRCDPDQYPSSAEGYGALPRTQLNKAQSALGFHCQSPLVNLNGLRSQAWEALDKAVDPPRIQRHENEGAFDGREDQNHHQGFLSQIDLNAVLNSFSIRLKIQNRFPLSFFQSLTPFERLAQFDRMAADYSENPINFYRILLKFAPENPELAI